ncbi:MAG: hypothetical protein JXA97_01515 [Anaerolineales bacterium]|nr:hypothetical protein [Anaerolineales bacterium]
MLARIVRRVLLITAAAILFAGSGPYPPDTADQARRLSDAHAFNATIWLLDAGRARLEGSSLNTEQYLNVDDGAELVVRYLDLIGREEDLQRQLTMTLAEGGQGTRESERLMLQLAGLQDEQNALQLVAEEVLQDQAASILEENGITTAGMVFPPLSFRFSDLPVALIVSPRDVIRQDANILLDPATTMEARIQLEGDVEAELEMSALVVGIGGLGYYPTLVMETTSLNWIAEVIIHEWVHNYLDFRPLGWNYSTSAELRTMNETTANLIGKSMGAALVQMYYPELAPQEAPPAAAGDEDGGGVDEVPEFDFRAEMYATRVTVDRLLEAGQIEAVEAYMETRRQVFVEHGFPIRRLNQAYFAFHGAYADVAGGAAGEDPVGEAVRRLWAESDTPAQFLRTMAWMDSYDDLLAALADLEQDGGFQP